MIGNLIVPSNSVVNKKGVYDVPEVCLWFGTLIAHFKVIGDTYKTNVSRGCTHIYHSIIEGPYFSHFTIETVQHYYCM
jgi:hypothetical protein